MAATELKSVEFVFYSKGIIEIFDVHTDFTAGRMLYLFRSITPEGTATRKWKKRTWKTRGTACWKHFTTFRLTENMRIHEARKACVDRDDPALLEELEL